VAQILAAAILGMASITKLTGNADAIALFTTLGAEPWGRWLVGLAELTAVVLLLRPRTAVLGGGMGIILMVGAIGAHLTRLGVLYQGDPSLFIMALMVLAASVTVVGLRRAAARA
jgi:uncharacterized ion transporter superfamily protein YfcC